MFCAGLLDSAAAMVTASVPMKLNMMVMNAPTTADRPLGANPPCSSINRLNPLASRSGIHPIKTAKPRPIKPMIATTLAIANQNSNSPYLETLNRLVMTSKTIDTSANSQVSICGNH